MSFIYEDQDEQGYSCPTSGWENSNYELFTDIFPNTWGWTEAYEQIERVKAKEDFESMDNEKHNNPWDEDITRNTFEGIH